MRRRLICVDVNVLYYFFTAHPRFGAASRELLKKYGGSLATSALSAWLLYVLIRREEVVDAVRIIANPVALHRGEVYPVFKVPGLLQVESFGEYLGV
jgi:hypothetical protein